MTDEIAAIRNLDLASLIPRRDTFTDSDGTKYEFRAVTDFGAVTRAKAHGMERAIAEARDALDQVKSDEKAAERIEALTAQLVGLLLPTLPSERLAALSHREHLSIIDWWNRQQVNGREAGESQADQPDTGSPG